jgi:hypothetical protein
MTFQLQKTIYVMMTPVYTCKGGKCWKNNSCLPTLPNFFQYVTLNTFFYLTEVFINILFDSWRPSLLLHSICTSCLTQKKNQILKIFLTSAFKCQLACLYKTSLLCYMAWLTEGLKSLTFVKFVTCINFVTA